MPNYILPWYKKFSCKFKTETRDRGFVLMFAKFQNVEIVLGVLIYKWSFEINYSLKKVI